MGMSEEASFHFGEAKNALELISQHVTNARMGNYISPQLVPSVQFVLDYARLHLLAAALLQGEKVAPALSSPSGVVNNGDTPQAGNGLLVPR